MNKKIKEVYFITIRKKGQRKVNKTTIHSINLSNEYFNIFFIKDNKYFKPTMIQCFNKKGEQNNIYYTSKMVQK